jgi:hypothetical protein
LVLSEKVGALEPVSEDRVRVQPGADWTMKYAYRTALTIAFTSADSDAVRAEETTPVFYERWERQAESIEIQTVIIASNLARVWADSVIAAEDAELEAVPLGAGFARGGGAVIDAGDRLIRATYFDGAPLDGPGMNPDERAAEVALKANAILLQLRN